MGSTASLRAHLVDELNDLLSAEQLIDALPKMAKKATDKKLTTIAERSVNRRASKEYREQAVESVIEKGARWMGMTAGRVASRVLPRASASERRRSRTVRS